MHVKFPSLNTDQISDPSYEEVKQVNKEQEATWLILFHNLYAPQYSVDIASTS